jgi:hypothetical protein
MNHGLTLLINVMDCHRLFFRRLGNCYVDHFLPLVITWINFPFLNGYTVKPVERLYCIGGINHFTYITRAIEYPVQVVRISL